MDLAAQKMVAAARACLGTRFRHQGRSQAAGLDCLGLIVVAARAAGMELKDAAAYSRQPNQSDFEHYVGVNRMSRCDKIKPGRVGVFDFGAGPQHVALFTPIGIIHAYAPARKVVEHGLRAPWPQQLSHILKFSTL
ncbi:MAG: NlpC/P60 family protein [Pseudomonadota bacterium]